MSARDIVDTWLADRRGRTAEIRRLRDDNGQLLGALRELAQVATELRRVAFISQARSDEPPPAWLRAADEAVIRAQATLQRYGGKP